jgi:hypothetical protein
MKQDELVQCLRQLNVHHHECFHFKLNHLFWHVQKNLLSVILNSIGYKSIYSFIHLISKAIKNFFCTGNFFKQKKTTQLYFIGSLIIYCINLLFFFFYKIK